MTFRPVLLASVASIYEKYFLYFIRSNSLYIEIIVKGEPLNVKKQPNKQSAIGDGKECKEDKRRGVVIREFGREYIWKWRRAGKCSLEGGRAY